jgi:hypothetical protein
MGHSMPLPSSDHLLDAAMVEHSEHLPHDRESTPRKIRSCGNGDTFSVRQLIFYLMLQGWNNWTTFYLIDRVHPAKIRSCSNGVGFSVGQLILYLMLQGGNTGNTFHIIDRLHPAKSDHVTMVIPFLSNS